MTGLAEIVAGGKPALARALSRIEADRFGDLTIDLLDDESASFGAGADIRALRKARSMTLAELAGQLIHRFLALGRFQRHLEFEFGTVGLSFPWHP